MSRGVYEWYLPFERDFDVRAFTAWIGRNWAHSITCAVVYVAAVFSTQRWMRGRAALQLRRPLVAWNCALAVFSVVGAVRVWPEMLFVLRRYGFRYSICNSSYASEPVPSCWATLFALSKVVELGDTLFVVLRKRRLLFLHWYHHITVMVYTWLSFVEHTAPGRWFIAVNLAVHACMYSYYALRAAGVRPPRAVPMAVTTLQLSQMVVGCVVSANTFLAKRRGHACQQSDANLRLSMLMYLSYFILFAHFFYANYYSAQGKFAATASAENSNKTK